MGLFLLHHVLLESTYPLLQVTVDLQVSFDDSFHAGDVLIHIVVLVAKALHIGDQLALFRQQLGRLFQVLEMLVPKLLFLLDELIRLLMERKQIRVYLHSSLATAASMHHVVRRES